MKRTLGSSVDLGDDCLFSGCCRLSSAAFG